MTNNFEGGYEDSYQKRDRLREELQSAFDELTNHLNIYKNDTGILNGYLKKSEENLVKFDELNKQKTILEEKIDQKQKESVKLDKTESDIDKKIDASASIHEDIYLAREKLTEVINAINGLMNEINAMNNEQTGMFGDSEGTNRIIITKYEKINEIMKQMKELDENLCF